MERGGTVYILTNRTHSTLYVGVTSDLYVQIVQHREKKNPKSFTARYKVYKLVYFESLPSIEEAITREKQVKGGSRQRKIDLIYSMNPNWEDLFEVISKW